MWQKEGISWQKGGNLRGKPDRRECIMTERRFHKETWPREGILWQTRGDFWRKTDKKKTLSDRREVIFWGKPDRKKAVFWVQPDGKNILSDRKEAISGVTWQNECAFLQKGGDLWGKSTERRYFLIESRWFSEGNLTERRPFNRK